MATVTAIKGNGTSGMVTAPASATTALVGGSMTIAAYINYATAATYGLVFGLLNNNSTSPNGSDFYIKYLANTTTFECRYRSAAGVTTTTSTAPSVATGAWHMIALVYNSATGTLTSYVDGVAGANTNNAAAGSVSANNGALRVLGTTVTGEYFQGAVYGAVAWPVAATAAQLATLKNATTTAAYNSAVTAIGTPAAYYKLSETSGTAIADSSGAARTATLSGTVTYNVVGPLTVSGAAQPLVGAAASASGASAVLTQAASTAQQSLAGAASSASSASAALTNAAVAPYGRGVNLAGMEFAPTAIPGVVGTSYFVPTAAEFDYYKAKGLTLMRVPFLWERIQPALGGALDPTYLGYLNTIVGYAAARGMTVILDVHNYGAYLTGGANHTIGAADGVVTQAHFTDLWTRLATYFKGQPVWYGLQNEPHDFAAGPYTANLVIHNFDNGTQGVTEESGQVVTASATAHTGAGAIQVAVPFGTGYSQARIRGGVPGGTNYAANGDTFSVWVYVPAGITGLQAYVGYLVPGTYATVSGSTVNLNPGWNQVATTYAGGLPTVADLLLQVWGVGVNQTVNILVDDWTAGTGVSGQQLWTNAAQAAITAIRATGATEKITAGGYAYSGASQWQTNNTNFILTDSGNNLIYEAHVYFDDDGSGTYVSPNGSQTASTYANELAGIADPVNEGARRIKVFTDWCAAHNVQGFIGEIGWVYDAADAASWNALANAAYAQLDSVGFPATYWAAGPSWGTYRLSVEPSGLGTGTVTDAAQMPVLVAHPSTTAATSSLSGSASSGSSASGALTQSASTATQPLAGAASSTAAANGALTQTGAAALPLVGTASFATAASAALTQTGAGAQPLIGAGGSNTSATASLTQSASAVTQPLAGTTSSQSSASASLTQTASSTAQPLIGTAASSTSSSAALTQTPVADQPLVGSANSATGASATFTQTGVAPQSLTGAGRSLSSASAALTQATATATQSIAGAASFTSSAGASLTQTPAAAQPLAGGASSGTSASAALANGVVGVNQLVGSASTASSATASLTQTTAPVQVLAGSASSALAASSTLTQTVPGVQPLAGSAASASMASAALTQTAATTQPLVGSASSASRGAAALTQTSAAAQALTASASSATSASASLTNSVPGVSALTGAAASGSTASASLTQTPAPAQPLTGSAITASSAAASLTQTPPGAVLTGRASSSTSASAALTQIPSTAVQPLTGSASSASSASSGVTQAPAPAQPLTGTAQSDSGARAALTQQAAGAQLLAGRALVASAASGALTQMVFAPTSQPLTGAATSNTSASGILSILTVARQHGTVTLHDEATATVTIHEEATATITLTDAATVKVSV